MLRDALLYAVRQQYGADATALPAAAGYPGQWKATWLPGEDSLVEGVTQQADLRIAAATSNASAKTWQAFRTTLLAARDFPTWTAAKNPRRFALDPAIGKLDAARDSFHWEPSGLPAAVS